MKSFLSFNLMVACAFLVFATQAHAYLLITPDNPTPYATGNDTSQADTNASLDTLIGTSDYLYKADVGGGDAGPLSASYDTTFLNTATDPSGAIIDYMGSGPYVGPPSYLLVKDGNQDPAWYLFDLSSTWNGMEEIQLSDFWPQQGAISHVALYGQSVPEPATMLLLGCALLGLVACGRKLVKRGPS